MVPEGRLDITVRSMGRLVVIENKPWAAEQPEQIRRYLDYIDGRAEVDKRLIYLTGDGSLPTSICKQEVPKRIGDGQLHCWSYREHILEWVTQCRAICRADRVSTFIDEFARYITKEFAGVADVTMQEHLVEEIVESAALVESAMQVIFAADDIRKRLISKLKSKIDTLSKIEEWSIECNMSIEMWSGLSIDFGPEYECVFKVQFDGPSYSRVIYGAARKDEKRPDDGRARAALLSIGPGKGTYPEFWLWWQYASLDDNLLPYERNWGSSSDSWVAMANGSMAEAIVKVARRFRDVMLSLQDGDDI